MNQKERLQALEKRIEAMDLELERVSTELLAFKLVFIRLSAFFPMTEHDVTAACELAIAQAEDAMPPDETPPETALALLESIRSVCDLAGTLYRQRMGE